MTIDLSISRWVGAVPARQWAREDQALDALGGAMPEVILVKKIWFGKSGSTTKPL